MRDQRQLDDQGETVEPYNAIVPADGEMAAHEMVSWSETPAGTTGGAAPGGAAGLLRVLRYKWSILFVFLLTAGATVPVVYYNVKPNYKCTAVVRVSPVVPKVVWETDKSEVTPAYFRHVNTQVSIIQSQPVLRAVLQREDVRDTPWYQKVADASGEVTALQIDVLLDSLDVRLRKDSELIDVSVIGAEQKSVTVLANAIVTEFETYNRRQLHSADASLLEEIIEKESRLEHEIRTLTKSRHEVSAALGTDTPADLRLAMSQYLNKLETEYRELERQHRLTVWELERAVSNQTEDDGGRAKSAAFAADPEWYRLSTNLQQARTALEAAKDRYGAAHPEYQARARAVASLEGLLAAREEQLRAGVGAAPDGSGVLDPRAIQKLVDRQQFELGILRRQIEDQRARVADASLQARDIDRYDADLTLLREQYDDVRSRRTQLETEGKAPARITIADYGIEPIRPFQSKRKKLAILALGGCFMLSVGLAYLRSRLDHRILEISDVGTAGRAPFLGQLPAIPDETTATLGGNPAFMECVRMIRTALLERLGGKTRQVILITSSTEQTGKTTLASLLARSLAVLGKKTLLVESDLRKPTLAKHFPTTCMTGLASLLEGTATDEEAIVPTQLRNLDIVFAGAVPADFNPELLANGKFSACLSRWRARYDLILLDSPPVLPVADSRILAAQADGAVMVLRASHTRRPDVIRAYADLSASGGRLLGSVLVGVPGSRGYGYGQYGSYGYAAALPGDQTEWTTKG